MIAYYLAVVQPRDNGIRIQKGLILAITAGMLNFDYDEENA